MSTFDAPSWEFCQVARARTNTPLQALALLNDTTYVEAARHFASRMIARHSNPDLRIRYGFRLATARFPSDAELSVLRSGLDDTMEIYLRNPDQAKKFVSHGDSPAVKLSNDSKFAELAVYTAVASVILNLDETITKD